MLSTTVKREQKQKFVKVCEWS